jgi:hypothetical protein
MLPTRLVKAREIHYAETLIHERRRRPGLIAQVSPPILFLWLKKTFATICNSRT